MENTDKPLIRDVRDKDFEQVVAIYNQYIIESRTTMDTQIKTSGYFRRLVHNFTDRESIMVLCKDDDLLGWGIIKQYSDRPGYCVACETAVYLEKSRRGQGYGTRLKKYIIDRCRHYQYHHLVAKIFAENTASIEYNKKLGYEIVGVQKEIGLINDEWKDIVIMQLILPNERGQP